jgi:hypothetical protein
MIPIKIKQVLEILVTTLGGLSMGWSMAYAHHTHNLRDPGFLIGLIASILSIMISITATICDGFSLEVLTRKVVRKRWRKRVRRRRIFFVQV